MRSTCVPVDGNVTVTGWVIQYAPCCQPQSARLVAAASLARFTSNADVDPIGSIGPPAAWASENCTHTESLYLLLLSAFIRSQKVYGVFASAVKVTST